MKITDVRVRHLFSQSRMKALVSIVLDGDFAVHDLKVIEGPSRTFVAMPSREIAPGEFADIVHPITGEARKTLEDTVLAAYYAAVAQQAEKIKEEQK